VNHRDVAGQLAAGLEGQAGWERHLEHHFRHRDAGVHLMVYGAEVTVVFGRLEGLLHDKAVSASTRYYPKLGTAAALEVAEALVLKRMLEQRLAHARAGRSPAVPG
jgi:hypothetical protein